MNFTIPHNNSLMFYPSEGGFQQSQQLCIEFLHKGISRNAIFLSFSLFSNQSFWHSPAIPFWITAEKGRLQNKIAKGGTLLVFTPTFMTITPSYPNKTSESDRGMAIIKNAGQNDTVSFARHLKLILNFPVEPGGNFLSGTEKCQARETGFQFGDLHCPDDNGTYPTRFCIRQFRDQRP